MADIQRYLDLITSEHQNKTKFTSWLISALAIIDDTATLANDMSTYFDLETAVGRQLDILGETIGVQRVVNFQPSDGSSPILDDDTFRIILRAKILQNQWDGTIPRMYELWNAVFPGTRLLIQDNQDMSMNIMISLFSRLQKDLTSNGYILPKPQGVKLTVILQVSLNSNDSMHVTESIIQKVRPSAWVWESFTWGQMNWR